MNMQKDCIRVNLPLHVMKIAFFMKSVSQTNCEENTTILNQIEQYMMQLLSH